MSRSTFNPISGDHAQPGYLRSLWIWLNRFDACLPQPVLANLRPFSTPLDSYPGPYLEASYSPSRLLSNLFWFSLPAAALRARLGRLDVIDIGCGRGNYKAVLETALGPLDSYTGIDVQPRPEWAALQAADPHCRFIEAYAENISPEMISGGSLIVSQSAIEHIRDDMDLMRHIAEGLRKRPGPSLQIHLLPSSHMWRQYGLHGYRGYSARALRRLLSAFPDFSTALYVLGGAASNAVHYDWIHDHLDPKRPDRRDDDLTAYSAAVRAALMADFAAPNTSVGNAAFLGLVIGRGLQIEAVLPNAAA